MERDEPLVQILQEDRGTGEAKKAGLGGWNPSSRTGGILLGPVSLSGSGVGGSFSSLPTRVFLFRVLFCGGLFREVHFLFTRKDSCRMGTLGNALDPQLEQWKRKAG